MSVFHLRIRGMRWLLSVQSAGPRPGFRPPSWSPPWEGVGQNKRPNVDSWVLTGAYRGTEAMVPESMVLAWPECTPRSGCFLGFNLILLRISHHFPSGVLASVPNEIYQQASQLALSTETRFWPGPSDPRLAKASGFSLNVFKKTPVINRLIIHWD